VPIDIASYRRWEGRAKATPLAALAIAQTMIRRRMRIRFVKLILWVFATVPSVVAMLVFYFTLAGEGPVSPRQLEEFGLKDVNLLAVLNNLFDRVIGFWAVLLAALVGAPLIAEDRRAHALPLYFSRPIGHFHYVAGKALSAAFFLALLLVLPRISMYFVELSFSGVEGVALRQLPTLLRSCTTGCVGICVLTSIALGVSSLTERPTYAALFLLGIGTVTTGLALHLSYALQDGTWLAVSPTACVQRIGIDLVPVPPQLRTDTGYLDKLPVREAWIGASAWAALGLSILFLRVRRVEVVT
jgi:ABC-type transport system involved in multi-copper enzyme maturation permease subunit